METTFHHGFRKWPGNICGTRSLPNGPLDRYVKLRVVHAPGIPGTFSPSSWVTVSNPDMHHGTCVTHVPRCKPGSLTSSFLWSRGGENVPGIPGACASSNFTYLVRDPGRQNARTRSILGWNYTPPSISSAWHLLYGNSWQNSARCWEIPTRHHTPRSLSVYALTNFCEILIKIPTEVWLKSHRRFPLRVQLKATGSSDDLVPKNKRRAIIWRHSMASSGQNVSVGKVQFANTFQSAHSLWNCFQVNAGGRRG